ncbi:MAG: DEAD/DEAH box helicase [Acidobacteria bacterium]|nr:DEAD/DEAH box helicase [Acidobacteriota bacterium]
MLIEEQIAERRQRARKEKFEIQTRSRDIFADYQVFSASSKRMYRVALRGLGLFDNYCGCPDFAVNTLGTCKHIEAALLHVRRRFGGNVERARYKRTHTTIYLDYGDPMSVRIALPPNVSPELGALKSEFFDAAGVLRGDRMGRFASAIGRLRGLDEKVVVYGDALEWIERELETAEGLAFESAQLRLLEQGKLPLNGLLKAPLYPFQMRGVLFAACRGRTVLADDMGLGKTIQAIGAAELLARRRGISRVLVICPASVKHQWLAEIGRFCSRTAAVIDGTPEKRKALYASTAFFKIVNYELVLRDLDHVAGISPDLIILDEAQRIRNWETATARTIKLLRSRYALVLTGTPLENKLEELYSVVQFVDGRRLGPVFRFLEEHREINEHGKLVGYRNLDQVREKLVPILLRRRRDQVLKDLPPRTDKIFRVSMTAEQASYYGDQQLVVAALVRKFERQGWLSLLDQQRLLCAIQNMRMICDSTFLFDKETRVSPKLEEFREIIRDLVAEEERKVVVFSEWERMTFLVGELLDEMKIGHVSLHGAIPSRRRSKLISQFWDDPKIKVFLSTDAGGVGINLQVASAVINMEPPWNPARLEQRIARVHRMGQSQPVLAVHLWTENSIEERVWETIRLKKALFSGLFDGTASEVSFKKLGRRPMMETLKEILSEAPPDQAGAELRRQERAPQKPGEVLARKALPPQPAPPDAATRAVGMLLEAGLKWLENLAKPAETGSPERVPLAVQPGPPRVRQKGRGLPPAQPRTLAETIEDAVSTLVKEDPVSRVPTLNLALPPSLTAERIAQTMAGALSRIMGRRHTKGPTRGTPLGSGPGKPPAPSANVVKGNRG